MSEYDLQALVAQAIADNPNADYKAVCDIVYALAEYMPEPAEVRIAVKAAMTNE